MAASPLFSAPEARPVPPRWWPTLLATTFVILCLFALALVPIWAASRIDVLRTEIEVVAQPTHPLATRLQFMYARQAASMRSYLLANDPSALTRYRDARAHEQEILYQLGPLTERLNPALPPQLRRIAAAAAGWHALADSVADGTATAADYRAAFIGQRDRYRAMIDSVEVFNAALMQETERRRAEIRAIERRHFALSVLLAVAGFSAGVAVWWLSRRERRFALRNAELLAASAQAERQWRFLAESSTIVGATLDYVVALRDLARMVVRQIATWCVVELFGDERDRRPERVAAAHADPAQEPALQDVDIAEALDTGRAAAVRAGEPVLKNDAAVSLVVAPLVARGVAIGTMTLASTDGRRYAEEDLEFIMDVVRRTALAVDNDRLYRDAVVASRAKSDFLAVVSHELRTPLTAVIGYAELLELELKGPLTPDQAVQVRQIKVSAHHLLAIIEEILSFTSLEASRESVTPGDVDVGTLLEEAAGIIAPLAEAKGLALAVIPPHPPIAARLDGAKVRRVLLNLLTNAVQFTATGEVGLEADADAGSVIFRVRDTGAGIAPADQERIFEPFTQLEPATTRAVGGLGLGLSIAHHLTQLLGGTLDVQSAPDAGSTFTVRLPRA